MILSLQQLSENIMRYNADITSKAQTIFSCVLPLLKILGYDIFNPKEVYAPGMDLSNSPYYPDIIVNKSRIAMFVQTKGEAIEKSFLSEFYDFFDIVVLTNGLEYEFYSYRVQKYDFVNPFFKINLLKATEEQYKSLSYFRRDLYSLEKLDEEFGPIFRLYPTLDIIECDLNVSTLVKTDFIDITIHKVILNGNTITGLSSVAQYYLKILELLLYIDEDDVYSIVQRLQLKSVGNYMLYRSCEDMRDPRELPNGYVVNMYYDTFAKIRRIQTIIKEMKQKVNIKIYYSKNRENQ